MAKFHSDPGMCSSSRCSPGLICLGCLVLTWGLACLSSGFFHLSSCPRHPLLPVWLLSLGGVLILVSFAIFALPTCSKTSVTPHIHQVHIFLSSEVVFHYCWPLLFSERARKVSSMHSLLLAACLCRSPPLNGEHNHFVAIFSLITRMGVSDSAYLAFYLFASLVRCSKLFYLPNILSICLLICLFCYLSLILPTPLSFCHTLPTPMSVCLLIS